MKPIRTTITRPEQAWAMLTILGVEQVDKLKSLNHDELRTIGRLLLWLADDGETDQADEAKETDQ